MKIHDRITLKLDHFEHDVLRATLVNAYSFNTAHPMLRQSLCIAILAGLQEKSTDTSKPVKLKLNYFLADGLKNLLGRFIAHSIYSEETHRQAADHILILLNQALVNHKLPASL
jgi:hypothetical protein